MKYNVDLHVDTKKFPIKNTVQAQQALDIAKSVSVDHVVC